MNTPSRSRGRRSVRIVLLALMLSAAAAPLRADVCFTHDATTEDLLLGTKTAELKFTYAGGAMMVEKETRFTGDWMKRFFGEVKAERMATHFLMDSDQIREIDWQNRRIFVFELDRLGDIQWIRQRQQAYGEVADHLKDRYTVKPPQLEIRIAPQPETVAGYRCRRVDARLRLETVNRPKQASSITLVSQTLWLTRDVPGFNAYDAFQHRLAARLGIEAERLGPLTYLLRYWEGPLAPIGETLKQIDGYTVKSDLTVIARYVTDTDTDTPNTIEKQIKNETIQLRQVNDAAVAAAEPAEPGGFEVIRPQ